MISNTLGLVSEIARCSYLMPVLRVNHCCKIGAPAPWSRVNRRQVFDPSKCYGAASMTVSGGEETPSLVEKLRSEECVKISGREG